MQHSLHHPNLLSHLIPNPFPRSVGFHLGQGRGGLMAYARLSILLYQFTSAGRRYLHQYIMNIISDLFVFDSDNFESFIHQYPVTFFILFCLIIMNCAINFQYQIGSMAIKIHDISVNHLLTAEMKSIKSISA